MNNDFNIIYCGAMHINNDITKPFFPACVRENQSFISHSVTVVDENSQPPFYTIDTLTIDNQDLPNYQRKFYAIGVPRNLNFDLLPLSAINRVALFIIEYAKNTTNEGCSGMDLMLLDLSTGTTPMYLFPVAWDNSLEMD